MYNRNTYV